MAGASRAIKDSEIENCKALGREPIAFRVGTDAISIVMSRENDFATDVTRAELAQIFSTAQKWSDIRPDWPAEEILRYVPGTDSGTFDYFVEAIMGPAYPNAEGSPNLEAGEKAFLEAANLNQSEDWIVCKVESQKFKGVGGPAKLEEMIAIFLSWARSRC